MSSTTSSAMAVAGSGSKSRSPIIPSTMLLSTKTLRLVSVAFGRRKNRAAMEEVVGEVREEPNLVATGMILLHPQKGSIPSSAHQEARNMS